MQVSNTQIGTANPYTSHAANVDSYSIENQVAGDKSKELSIEDEVKKSAVQVSISMNAQIVLYAMDSQKIAKENSSYQNNIFGFLSGKEVDNTFSLKDLGYDGKPITELSQEEAKELISDKGFFGVEETSQRVADFVFKFSGYDIDLLEKGREGIVKGFEEANKLWGGELPEISYKTQDSTLALIDARIADLKHKAKDN